MLIIYIKVLYQSVNTNNILLILNSFIPTCTVDNRGNEGPMSVSQGPRSVPEGPLGVPDGPGIIPNSPKSVIVGPRIVDEGHRSVIEGRRSLPLDPNMLFQQNTFDVP